VKSKPKLLVVELWGLGDLLIATPFLQAASKKYAVTLLAKPYAKDLQARFWKDVEVAPFIAPWTAFKHKYRLFSWPWREIFGLRKLVKRRFDAGLSARWDPRDHWLLMLLRVKMRLGFPRTRSELFLTHPLTRPDPRAHRYEHWRVMARALEIELPAREKLPVPARRSEGDILVHTGAGQPIRVWPLPRYLNLVRKLRSENHRVQVACDPEQRNWWLTVGEKEVATPRTVSELLTVIDRAGAFIGNDSGPGHLAAFCGVPTFTLFGPQLPEWFAPLHPGAQWFEGKACPFKPCSDYCRFPDPMCLMQMTEEEVWTRVEWFVAAQGGIQMTNDEF
jgi:ADP-heptose:LPS heptosyltransferase